MTALLFFIILGALVFVHELGHFISAKRAGIRVDEFALGFPPRLFSKTVGETKYSLNLVPFGGYVKIFGEDGDEDADKRGFKTQINADIVAESSLVNRVTESAVAEVVSADDTRRFTSKSRWTQALVLSSGILGNLVFAWVLLSVSFMLGIPSSTDGRYADEVRDAKLMITGVLPDSPAALQGLKAGDEIISLEGEGRRFEKKEVNEARAFIGASEQTLTIAYRRAGASETVEIVPVKDIIPGKSAIGVMIDTVGVVRFGFFRSLFEGLLMTADLVREVAVGLVGFIGDAVRGSANLGSVTGPIGIAGMVGEARTLGLVYLLSFTAFISINLAVINLLPIPALDGGRLFFLALEGIFRRAIPTRISRTLNATGFILLILLMIVITYRDIIKLFSL